MNSPTQLVVFILDDRKFALPLSQVERVISAIEITPLPRAPEIVMGIVNIQGRVIPVVNMRRRFHLPEREINLNDKLMLSQTSRMAVGIMADSVGGVIECDGQEVIVPEKIVPGMEYVEGVVKLAGGLTLIHNIDKFLSLGEEKTLYDAMDNR